MRALCLGASDAALPTATPRCSHCNPRAHRPPPAAAHGRDGGRAAAPRRFGDLELMQSRAPTGRKFVSVASLGEPDGPQARVPTAVCFARAARGRLRGRAGRR